MYGTQTPKISLPCRIAEFLKALRFLGFLSLFIALSLCGCTRLWPDKPIAKGDFATVGKRLSEEIRRDMAENSLKGLSIALVDDDQVVWAEAFGWADEAGKVPARTDTVYRVGSVSKVFTATAAMALAEAGQLDIDQPLSRYLPEFSIRSRFPQSAPITLRSLMTHHSGLPTDVLKGMFTDTPLTLAQYVPLLAQESMAAPVGTEFKYSNIALSLLGRVIEKSTGLPFAQAMNTVLLTPLGMTGSGFARTPAMDARLAKGYHHGLEVPFQTLRDAPTGALMSSVEDLSLFLRFVLSNGRAGQRQVLTEQTLAAMLEPQYPGQPLDFGHRQGLGWMLSGLALADGEQLVWHNGAVVPYQSHLSFLPESGLGVVLLANSDEAATVLAGLGIKALELAKQAKFGLPPPPAKQSAPTPRTISLPTGGLEGVAGNYAAPVGVLTPVRLDGRRLSASLWNRDLHLVPVEPETPGVPSGPIQEVTLMPVVPKYFGLLDKPQTGMLLKRRVAGGRQFLYQLQTALPYALERISPSPIPAAWTARLGRYAADTTGELLGFETLELYEESGLLLARATTLPGDRSDQRDETVIILRPVSDDEAVVAGVGNSTGGAVRATPEGLYHTGFLYRPAQLEGKGP